ncbi:MAG: Crp/Fnr family transcriptional regulator [Rubrivivax sp.]|nr:Crp/Fnr family transcriptional regulator [Rubrivivax sp.]MDP3223733.1 Crp/Fnr family transcriptional regulator [Rubrivivax sp.]MDP3610874.1 Crp/Fnr family transcriptional regulator [Rubrivivax sp.]
MNGSKLHEVNPLDNHLLAALPPDVWGRILPALSHVSLERGQVLCTSGQALSNAYFPTSALVSMMHFTASGSSAETAAVGNDGMVGLWLVMGGGTCSSCTVVRASGDAFRLPADALGDEFLRTGAMMQLLLRYSQALMTQTSHLTLCNRHHSVTQRLARLLLQQLDRVQGRDLVMTQELIAEQLGVRREGVTGAAGILQRVGLIRYGRGRITVLDRPGLERMTCECYAAVQRECRRLLPVTGKPCSNSVALG